jgi:hypothetical protein
MGAVTRRGLAGEEEEMRERRDGKEGAEVERVRVGRMGNRRRRRKKWRIGVQERWLEGIEGVRERC